MHRIDQISPWHESRRSAADAIAEVGAARLAAQAQARRKSPEESVINVDFTL
jgi:hypothetical protein